MGQIFKNLNTIACKYILQNMIVKKNKKYIYKFEKLYIKISSLVNPY